MRLGNGVDDTEARDLSESRLDNPRCVGAVIDNVLAPRRQEEIKEIHVPTGHGSAN